MVLAIVFVAILALLGIDRVITRHGTRRDRATAHAAPLPAGVLATTVTSDAAEQALTTWLFAGRLDRVDYRETMAALAATERRMTGVDPLPLIAMDRNGVGHVRRLGIAMPTVSRAALFAAVALAHNGATAENLTRLLGLTEAQAAHVITTTGLPDHGADKAE